MALISASPMLPPPVRPPLTVTVLPLMAPLTVSRPLTVVSPATLMVPLATLLVPVTTRELAPVLPG